MNQRYLLPVLERAQGYNDKIIKKRKRNAEAKQGQVRLGLEWEFRKFQDCEVECELEKKSPEDNCQLLLCCCRKSNLSMSL